MSVLVTLDQIAQLAPSARSSYRDAFAAGQTVGPRARMGRLYFRFEKSQNSHSSKSGLSGAPAFSAVSENYCGLAGGVVAFLAAVPVVLLVAVAGFFAGVAGCRGSMIFTCVSFGGSNGRSLRGSVARRVIRFTRSMLSHCPNKL